MLPVSVIFFGGNAVLACQSFISDPTQACLAVERAKVNYHARCDSYPPIQAEDQNILSYCEAVVRANGTSYSVDVANACLRGIQTATPNCEYFSNAACEQLGTLPAGAPCMDDVQCASGVCGLGNAWWASNAYAAPGYPPLGPLPICATCAPNPRVWGKEGASCDNVNLCDGPWACEASGTSGVCAARATDGETCLSTTDRESCSSHYFSCAYIPPTPGTKCVRIVSPGGACQSTECDLASACDWATSTCQVLFPTLYAGEVCNQGGFCASELVCTANPSICVQTNGVGQPCVGAGACQNYLQCDANNYVCTAFDFSKCP